ncbi:MAG: D-amino-acid dehydrogenase [Candidatus Moranbacteria bacterium GW2011_GWA2_39_41]|nr:MAG: D-amino-acid dehydrogenase [Candidatus Moranbacteria bacterium GW2011_GWA2_39_41]
MNKLTIGVAAGIIIVFTAAVGYFFAVKSTDIKVSPKQTVGADIKNITADGGTGDTNCIKQYENILAKYQQNFDDCRLDIKKSESCDKDPNNSSAKQKNVVVIFDSSGSMAALVGNKKKIDIAKESVFGFFRDFDKSTNLSVVLYGHKGSNSQAAKKASCDGIEEIYYMGPPNVDIAISKLTGAKPTGWTPIAASLQKAGDILKNYPADKNDNMILLISDGEETCGGDPVTKAKELMTNLKIVTNVIGFDVAGAEEKKLQAIAGSGSGKYFSVHNEEEFKTALKENKNFMAGFDCYMKQSNIWLDNQLDTTFKRNDCLHRLDMDEKHEIELNANILSDGITSECKDFVISTYQTRYNEIKNEIEKKYTANKNDTVSEKNELEKTRADLDSGEDVFVP